MKKALYISLLLITFFYFSGCASFFFDDQTSQWYQYKPKKAYIENLRKEYLFDEALTEYNKCLASYPKMSELILIEMQVTRGEQYTYFSDIGATHKAIPVMRSIIDNCYDCSVEMEAEFVERLAKDLANVERYEDAIITMYKSIDMQPEVIGRRIFVYQMYFLLEDFENAFKELEKASKIEAYDGKSLEDLKWIEQEFRRLKDMMDQIESEKELEEERDDAAIGT